MRSGTVRGAAGPPLLQWTHGLPSLAQGEGSGLLQAARGRVGSVGSGCDRQWFLMLLCVSQRVVFTWRAGVGAMMEGAPGLPCFTMNVITNLD